MITREQVEYSNLLSQAVLEDVPKKCECGADIVFTDTLRQVYCANDKCMYKIAARLEDMTKKLKIDDWGESTCIKVVQELNRISGGKFTSPYQIFQIEGLIQKGWRANIPAFDKKMRAILDKSKRRLQLWEVVLVGGLPSIANTAYKIFGGYSSMEEAYAEIEKGQVPYIAEKLGMSNIDTGIMAVKIFNTLVEYKDELMLAESCFDIYSASGETISIAITGGVYGYNNKSEFIAYINNRYAGKANAILKDIVSINVDILIADGDTSSHKYSSALRINNKYVNEYASTHMQEASEHLIGKRKNEKDIKRIGEKIVITSSEEIIGLLDKHFN